MTAVEKLVSNIRALAYDKRHHLGMGDIRITQGLLDELEEQAKEMEKEQMISLLEWIRNNAVEVQGGWQYNNWTYTDKEILEVYYKQSKQQEQ